MLRIESVCRLTFWASSFKKTYSSFQTRRKWTSDNTFPWLLQNFYDLNFFHDFSRPGNDHFKSPWLFQVFHDRTNPDSKLMLWKCVCVCVCKFCACLLVCYLQWCEDWGGDDDEEPEVHVEELTDHIGHVGWKDQQEQTQRHRAEVFPQTPKRTESKRQEHQLLTQHDHFVSRSTLLKKHRLPFGVLLNTCELVFSFTELCQKSLIDRNVQTSPFV